MCFDSRVSDRMLSITCKCLSEPGSQTKSHIFALSSARSTFFIPLDGFRWNPEPNPQQIGLLQSAWEIWSVLFWSILALPVIIWFRNMPEAFDATGLGIKLKQSGAGCGRKNPFLSYPIRRVLMQPFRSVLPTMRFSSLCCIAYKWVSLSCLIFQVFGKKLELFTQSPLVTNCLLKVLLTWSWNPKESKDLGLQGI